MVLYLLANFTLALSIQPHMQVVTTVQLHNPETFFGWNAKERCEDERAQRLDYQRNHPHQYGPIEVVGECMGV